MACNSGGHENHGGLTILVISTLIAMSSRLVPCQTSSSPSPATPPAVAAPLVQTPAYEVATIKPWDGTGFCSPLRVYIQVAFGISPNTTGWVIGPAWIDSTRYVIRGRTPDSIQNAMQTMTAAERKKERSRFDDAISANGTVQAEGALRDQRDAGVRVGASEGWTEAEGES